MVIDKLAIYNNALLLLGERTLATVTENREPRRLLDHAYDFGAVDYCLEIVKPVFARKTVMLDVSTPSPHHDLDNVFTLPADWLATVEVYSDSRLDQPISRYINEDRTIACEYDIIYVRYVTSLNSDDYAKWSPVFTHVVASYLAREISLRLTPDDYETLDGKFGQRVDVAKNSENDKEPPQRSKAKSTTLTETWRNIYNDALLILGQTKITDINDDSHRRSVLDTAINADIVTAALEDIGWHWALKSMESEYNPSLEPTWGWRYAHDWPIDLHRLEGIYQDEYFQVPLKSYLDENKIFFTDSDIMYIQYVSIDFINSPDAWSPSFRRLIAARIAKDTYMTLNPAAAEKAEGEFSKRESAAKTIDVMQSPPRVIAEGNWVRARTQGRSNRRRP
jgi:hypothetical protein